MKFLQRGKAQTLSFPLMQFFSLVPDFRTPIESKFTIFDQQIFFSMFKGPNKSFQRFSGKIFTAGESSDLKLSIDAIFFHLCRIFVPR